MGTSYAPRSTSSETSYTPDASEDAVCIDPTYESNAAAAASNPAASQENTVREATENLGECRGLDNSFTSTGGAILDALMPTAGDQGKLQLNLNVPIDQTGTVRVGFEFVIEGERDDTGVKGKIQVGGTVSASQEVDLYFAAAEVFAQARVFGYAESYGDSSTEMLDLLILGLQQRVAQVDESIAGAVFDADQIETTRLNMDEDDYVETGVGVGVEVGAGVSAGDDEGPEVGAGAEATTGTRLTSNGSGGLQAEGVTQVSGALSGELSPFGVEGEISAKWVDSTLDEVEASISGSHSLDGDALNDLMLGGRWLSGAVGAFGSLITGGSGMLQDANATRQAAGLAAFVSRTSMSGALVERSAARAIADLEGMGVSIGHKLTLKAAWSRKDGFSGEFTLERTTEIEYGDSPRDTVYALVEMLQRVVQFELGGS